MMKRLFLILLLIYSNAFQTWSDVSTLAFIGTRGEMGEFMII